MAMSFVEQVISSRDSNIYAIKTHMPSGEPAIYYLMVHPGKAGELLKKIKTESVDLNNYGEILTSCYGHKPTLEVKNFLKEKYEFDVKDE